MGTLSYWQRTARASINYQALPATADLVIIGGGIMGVSSAYFAALAGLNTVLIDQVALAYGATGRNGGFIGGGAADSYSSVRERYGAETAQSIWGGPTRAATARARDPAPVSAAGKPDRRAALGRADGVHG
jgi:glycine/D-amino acid oxidase-like deaminating enzyme